MNSFVCILLGGVSKENITAYLLLMSQKGVKNTSTPTIMLRWKYSGGSKLSSCSKFHAGVNFLIDSVCTWSYFRRLFFTNHFFNPFWSPAKTYLDLSHVFNSWREIITSHFWNLLGTSLTIPSYHQLHSHNTRMLITS